MTLSFNHQVEIYNDNTGETIRIEPWDEGEPEVKVSRSGTGAEPLGSMTFSYAEAAMVVKALLATLKAVDYYKGAT